jgi:hypothetical protein
MAGVGHNLFVSLRLSGLREPSGRSLDRRDGQLGSRFASRRDRRSHGPWSASVGSGIVDTSGRMRPGAGPAPLDDFRTFEDTSHVAPSDVASPVFRHLLPVPGDPARSGPGRRLPRDLLPADVLRRPDVLRRADFLRPPNLVRSADVLRRADLLRLHLGSPGLEFGGLSNLDHGRPPVALPPLAVCRADVLFEPGHQDLLPVAHVLRGSDLLCGPHVLRLDLEPAADDLCLELVYHADLVRDRERSGHDLGFLLPVRDDDLERGKSDPQELPEQQLGREQRHGRQHSVERRDQQRASAAGDGQRLPRRRRGAVLGRRESRKPLPTLRSCRKRIRKTCLCHHREHPAPRASLAT